MTDIRIKGIHLDKKGCEFKRQYYKRDAKRLAKTTGLEYYECECGWFHLGHKMGRKGEPAPSPAPRHPHRKLILRGMEKEEDDEGT